MAARRVPGLVSVVVTSWNRRKYILQCLDSMVRQSYRNIEIIVVDDGSTDGTARFVQSWRRRLPAYWRSRIFIVPLPRNVGYSGALTTAMFSARGEFIATHDSDDVSHPLRIERQVRFLRSHPAIGLIGTNYHTLHHGKVDTRPNRWLAFGQNNVRRRYLRRSHCITCGSLLFRAGIFDRNGGLNRRMAGAEDYEFVQRLFNNGVKMDNLPDVLYYVRSHGHQRSRKYYR